MPSPKSMSVLSAAKSGFGIPAKPGDRLLLTTTQVRALSTSRIGIPAMGFPESSRATGFTTSLAPMTMATSVWAKDGLTSSISLTCS